MFRIRRIYDSLLPINRKALDQVLEILRVQFPLLTEAELAKLPEQLRNPMKYRFRSVLFVANDQKGNTKGFALLMHDPDLKFCFLDYISTERGGTGRGIGGALYQRVREEAQSLHVIGIFFECLPDDLKLIPDPDVLRHNVARLRFYERYGAHPVIGTAYETPVAPGSIHPTPYLVFDPLGQDTPLPAATLRRIVRAILERKYHHICPPSYVEMVLASIKDDPVRLRPFKYVKTEAPGLIVRSVPPDKRIALIISDRQAIHHVRERGYVESPVRISTILRELDRTDCFEKIQPVTFPDEMIKEVHDPEFVDYLKRVCNRVVEGESVYPYVFPVRNVARPPKELSLRAGYYCIDTFTPLNQSAWVAARRAVDCALTGARSLLSGHHVAYVLVRPPGHHAERRSFGGFCYLNSTAIAANFLSRYGKIAILDIDYHHGNGTQFIFYERPDVLTISIHGHPSFAYPYFSGFEDERGAGPGEGCNWNLPLPEEVSGERYRVTLRRVLRKIEEWKPQFLVVAFGLDTARNDPTGSWSLLASDFEANGTLIGAVRLPTLVVQEGGYDNRVLGINARNFFQGLWVSAFT